VNQAGGNVTPKAAHPLASKGLEHLYYHCRHPLLLAPMTALLTLPVMTGDRLLLALAYALYMCTCNSPTWVRTRG
jgi:hypothetical protein